MLLLVAVASLFVGKWGLPDESAVYLFSQTGYWFVCLNFIGFIYFIYLTYRLRIKSCVKVVQWASLIVPALVVVGSVSFVSRAEPMGFKTIMDEHTIASTAQGLHLHREATASMRFHTINGSPVLLNNKIDKRPIFFPFLTSLVHDVFGYHAENSIRLNVFILCPLLFILLYILGNRLSGEWGGAVLSVLVATIPLCGFIFRGGGLELLNLVMLVAVMLIAMDFWETPSAASCGALCLGTVLLAQTRYESVLFVLPVALLIALQWLRTRRLEVYWPLWITPIFLIPYLWQNRVFGMSATPWQLEGKERPFGLEYLPDNWARSVYYFFNGSASVPNSWLLAVAGVVVGVLVVVLLRGQKRLFSLEGRYWPIAVYYLGFLMLYGMLLCYSWDFGGPVVQRLCLPLYLPLAILVVIYLGQLGWHRRGVRFSVFGVLLIYTLGYSYPTSSLRSYDMGDGWIHYGIIHEMFEAGELDSQAIYVSENASFYSIYRYACTSNISANHRKQEIANYVAQSGARPIYAMTRVRYNGDQYFDENFSHLDPEFKLEPVIERWLDASSKLVFSRVVGVEGYVPEDSVSDNWSEYRLKYLHMLP